MKNWIIIICTRILGYNLADLQAIDTYRKLRLLPKCTQLDYDLQKNLYIVRFFDQNKIQILDDIYGTTRNNAVSSAFDFWIHRQNEIINRIKI